MHIAGQIRFTWSVLRDPPSTNLATKSLVLVFDKVQVVFVGFTLSRISFDLHLHLLELISFLFAWLWHVKLFNLTLIDSHFLLVLNGKLL